MSIDFLNSYTNKQAGKKTSVGLISGVCLNIPSSMHYKPKNMSLAGVIPRPKEPPLTTLDHYLKSLVDSLVDFWQTSDMLIVCIDMGACNFSDLPLIDITEIMSI